MSEEEYCQQDARSNINSLYSFLIAKAFVALGGQHVVICPGSRNTPLVCAFANVDGVECSSVLDERSASFFALGIAKRTKKPVAVICTSGSAVANFLPAVVEAYYSRIPLMIFSADRPPELRNCFSGQTIRQENIFGNYVDQFTEMPIPEKDNLDQAMDLFVAGFLQAEKRNPVHFNFPFRDPLVPTKTIDHQLADVEIAPLLDRVVPSASSSHACREELSERLCNDWSSVSRGVIIAGSGVDAGDADRVAQLAHALSWPVLADTISSLRGQARDRFSIITAYDAILRDAESAQELVPEGIIVLGPLPTSKILRQWLARLSVNVWMIDSRAEDISANILTGERVYADLSEISFSELKASTEPTYHDTWVAWENKYRSKWKEIDFHSQPHLSEPMIPFLLEELLPEQANLMVANSTPVRDLEFFWAASSKKHAIFCNRGANGIDGTLSTAVGIAHQSDQPSYLLTGDLALLHDANGFLIQSELVGNLTVILINNQGGGIFSLLPIHERPEFEKFFQTTQSVEWSALAKGWQVHYQWIDSSHALAAALADQGFSGIRILEIPCSASDGKALRSKLLG